MALRVDYIDADHLRTDSNPPLLPGTRVVAALTRMGATSIGSISNFDSGVDGDTFTVNDGTGAQTFELDDDGTVGGGNIAIPIGQRLAAVPEKGALHAPGAAGANFGLQLAKFLRVAAEIINANTRKEFSATLGEDHLSLALRNEGITANNVITVGGPSNLTVDGLKGGIVLAKADIVDVELVTPEAHRLMVVWEDGT